MAAAATDSHGNDGSDDAHATAMIMRRIVITMMPCVLMQVRMQKQYNMFFCAACGGQGGVMKSRGRNRRRQVDDAACACTASAWHAAGMAAL